MAATYAFDRDAARRLIGTDPAATRLRIDMLERVLERAFVIPGINRGVGLDAVIGFVPVAGDVIAGVDGAVSGLGSAQSRYVEMADHPHARQCRHGYDDRRDPAGRRCVRLSVPVEQQELRIIKKHLDKHHPGTALVNAR